jgi:ATP-binding cassette subfamily B protein RaxB
VDLLVVLALGFGLLVFFKAATTAIKSIILLVIQNVLHFQLGARLFHHLIRLPIAFSRSVILATCSRVFPRFNRSAIFQPRVLIADVLDGIIAAITLAMIFLYSTQLATAVLGAFALYGSLRLALYKLILERTEETI